MINKYLFLLMAFSFGYVQSQTEQQLENLKTFAKAYGYVKYFHPSDEAATLDWDDFAVYGAGEVLKCSSEKETIDELNTLFLPVAPTAEFYEAKNRKSFDVQKITPDDVAHYELIYWQHQGVGFWMDTKSSTYQSVRVNGMNETNNASTFGNILSSFDPTPYLGEKIKYTAWVKMGESSKRTGYLWLSVENSDRSPGFYENMERNPIAKKAWNQYEIIGKIDSLASSLSIGCSLNGKGNLLFDNVKLAYWDGEGRVDIPMEDGSFESGGFDKKNVKVDGEIQDMDIRSPQITRMHSKGEIRPKLDLPVL